MSKIDQISDDLLKNVAVLIWVPFRLSFVANRPRYVALSRVFLAQMMILHTTVPATPERLNNMHYHLTIPTLPIYLIVKPPPGQLRTD